MKHFFCSGKITEGKLIGTTDTDYFYFLCPTCGDTQVLQIVDFEIISEDKVQYAPNDRPKAKKDFSIGLKIYCENCKMEDSVKISNTGWQGGKLKDSPSGESIIENLSVQLENIKGSS